MSNTLIRAAHRVRGISPAERTVLVVLADDARDHLGGRSRLTAGDIARRTELADRSIRRIIGRLAAAGHLTREPGEPGAPVVTLVHPDQQIAATENATAEHICPGPQSPPPRTAESAPPGLRSPPPIRETDLLPITHSPQASAREDFSGLGERQKEATGMVPPAPQGPEPEKSAPAVPETALDPVAAVFDAWDAMRARNGLPGGPVVRDMARRVAVDLKLRGGDLPQLLGVIAKVGETVRAGGMRKKAAPGQSDIFATFDAVFEIGHAAGLRLFTRLLDGQEWGAIAGPDAAAATPPLKGPDLAANALGEPPDITRLRQLLHDKLGGRSYANWIEPLRFEKDPGGVLRVFAKSLFMVDRVRSDFGHQIGGAARAVWPGCDEVLFGLSKSVERV